MDISAANTSASVATTASAAPEGSARKALAIQMLKKALESQQDQARELMNLTEGKGQRVDIRA